jgi:hypothetical protein
LEVCLHCGHTFCNLHRDVIDGLPACTDCLKAEKARRRKPQALRIVPGEPVGAPPEAIDPSPRPPAPLPEPKGMLVPLALGAAAAAPSGAYMWWLLNTLTLEHEWPASVPQVGTAAFAAFVFAGVWAIARSK